MFRNINQFVQQQSTKKYSFITGNGTSALYLALKSSGIQKGSKIAVSNITCPDPVYALIWAGYKPIFVDVNLDDYNMSVESLKDTLSKEKDIKAVIAIHLFGNPCEIEQIQKICKENNLFLLEDCAQSLGNEVEGKKLGSFGDVSIFSFGNGKIIENEHGASVQSDNRDIMEKIKLEYQNFTSYDQIKRNKLSKYHRWIYYKLYYLGIKYPMLNILNLIYVYFFKEYYLYKLDENQFRDMHNKIINFQKNRNDRVNIVKFLQENLKDIKHIYLPKITQFSLSRYTVVVDDAEFISKMIRDTGIPSNTMYPMLVDRFKLFYKKSDFNNSVKLKGRLLNLWTNSITYEQMKQTVKLLGGLNG